MCVCVCGGGGGGGVHKGYEKNYKIECTNTDNAVYVQLHLTYALPFIY